MEPDLDPNLPPALQPMPVAKKSPLKEITLLVTITVLALGIGYWFIYPKASPQPAQNPKPGATTLVETSSAKISWVSNPPRLGSLVSQNNNQETTHVSAICLPGTTCQDTVISQTDIPNYYACTLDKQCSFFTGFTGVQTGNEMPTKGVPAQTRYSVPPTPQSPSANLPPSNPPLPTAVQGTEGCFNKQELLQNANNKDNLKENISIACECGIQPPSDSISGSPSVIDANTGEVTPGTVSIVKNQYVNLWSCVRPGIYPDIATGNFAFPKNISVNSPFSISFDYKNVGSVECRETRFLADVTRTIANKSEYLGGTGADILYETPIKPGEGSTFTFGNQSLPNFDIAGDYKLDLTMFCEWPLETHMVNGLKEIHIQVN